MRILCYSAAKNETRPKIAYTAQTIWHTGRYTAKQGVFCSQYRFLLLSLFWVSENMTFKCLSKLAVTHKLRQRLNTARTIWTGTHPSLLNNSHTGRHAVKQGRKIHFTLQQASSVTKEIAFLCLASQILNSPIARFLLYTTCIVKRAHKPQQTPNTARTIRSGTHPSCPNKSHTGRHTAKRSANLVIHIERPK